MTRGFALATALLALTLAAAFAPRAAAQQSSTPAPPLPCPTQPSAAPATTPPAVDASQSSSSQTTTPSDAWHCVNVQFQYDFSKTPPCAATGKPKHPCVAQFAIYDTTAGTAKGHRTFLFYVGLPAKRSGVVPISGMSPKQVDFQLGWHKLGVGALDDTGKDSHMKFCDSCATWIDVEAGSTPTPSTPAPGTSNAPPGTTPSPTPPSAMPHP